MGFYTKRVSIRHLPYEKISGEIFRKDSRDREGSGRYGDSASKVKYGIDEKLELEQRRIKAIEDSFVDLESLRNVVKILSAIVLKIGTIIPMSILKTYNLEQEEIAESLECLSELGFLDYDEASGCIKFSITKSEAAYFLNLAES